MEVFGSYEIEELTVDNVYNDIVHGLERINIEHNPDLLKSTIKKVIDNPLSEESTFITYTNHVGHLYIRRLRWSKLILVFGYMNDNQGEVLKEVELFIKYK